MKGVMKAKKTPVAILAQDSSILSTSLHHGHCEEGDEGCHERCDEGEEDSGHEESDENQTCERHREGQTREGIGIFWPQREDREWHVQGRPHQRQIGENRV